MSFVLDATNIRIDTSSPPRRIISLVPSTTQSICALGSHQNLVGITRFCTEPAQICTLIPKVGGTKNVSLERVLAQNPDIVLANLEENTKEDVEAIRDQGIPVYVSFPMNIQEALSELSKLGTILHKEQETSTIIETIQKQRSVRSSFRYAYLIWNDPIMSISSDCFISSMMKEIGGINLFQEHEERYPHIEEIPSDLDALILSSEPFPFREKHRRLLSKRFAIPINKVYFIDGAYCSWHGAKMKEALPYLHQWRSRL